MPLDLIPAGFFDEKWTQQVHDGCGGEIVIIVKRDAKQMAACCKGCKAIWNMPQIEGYPRNWRAPSRLIIP